LIEEADPEAIRLDDLESNASVDEDAVPMRKVTANNKVRLLCPTPPGKTDNTAGYANLD